MSQIKTNGKMTDRLNDDADLRQRRGEISAYGRAVQSWRYLQGLTALAFVIVLGLIAAAVYSVSTAGAVVVAVVGLGICLLIAMATGYRFTRRNFVEPDRAIRKWLQQVCDGDTEARIDLPPEHNHFQELDFHTKNLGLAFTRLTTDMDDLVASQTTRLEQQNKSLELLFNLTSDVAKELDQTTVLRTVCRHLVDWYGDSRVSAYVVNDGKTTLAATQESRTNPAKERVSTSTKTPLVSVVDRIEHELDLNGQYRHRTGVPVRYGSEVGALILIESVVQYPTGKHDTLRVLHAISEQLSLFEAKRSAIDKSKMAEASKERVNLAGDIHDSLAQTLTAVRYQVNILEDSLNTPIKTNLKNEFEHLKGTIDEANLEVRGLIGEYRKPLTERRSLDAIRETVDQLQRKTDARVFFQLEDQQLQFSQREESQIQRIVGEALNNAIKYSDASIIRVLIGSNTSGVRRVLVEDDGKGFDLSRCETSIAPAVPGHQRVDEKVRASGEHIGLSIMHERATTIGAKLGIESEPGEGTRVSIELPPADTFVQSRADGQ